jgi:hypothetical protein
MAALFVVTAACGKKGPPLAPLNLVPDRPPEIDARVQGATTVLQFTIPSKNANGPGPLALDHLEVYAVTVAAGAVTPANREWLTPSHVIGRIAVKPPPDPDAPEEDSAEKDTRPAPGAKVSFAEPLTAAQVTPEILPKPGKPATGSAAGRGGEVPPVPALPAEPTPPTAGAAPPTPPGGETPPATPPGAEPGAAPTAPAAPAAAAPPLELPTRVYVLRGITRKGKPGPPSARVTIPLVPSPLPPTGVAASFGEKAVTVKWTAPEGSSATAPPLAYNVYAAPPPRSAAPAAAASLGPAPAPVNAQRIDALSFEHGGAAPGTEQCFVVRAVETVLNISIESAPSEPACVTPRDIFPPSAPKGLAAVSGTGVINLIWDPNPEPDVAGYLVLRAEAPSDTLQPLTPAPVRDARYADATVKPGVRYVYAVIAVDRAEPPNRSAPSNRVEETAR